MQEIIPYSLLSISAVFYLARYFPGNVFNLSTILEFFVVFVSLILVIITVWYNQSIESNTQLILASILLGIVYDISSIQDQTKTNNRQGLGAAIACLQYIKYSIQSNLYFIQIIIHSIGIFYVIIQLWNVYYLQKHLPLKKREWSEISSMKYKRDLIRISETYVAT